MRDDTIIEKLDADYEESLKNLDDINTMQCGKHIKNCALQNVFKIFEVATDSRNIKKNCEIEKNKVWKH